MPIKLGLNTDLSDSKAKASICYAVWPLLSRTKRSVSPGELPTLSHYAQTWGDDLL